MCAYHTGSFPPGTKEDHIPHILLANTGALGLALAMDMWAEMVIPLWDDPRNLPADPHAPSLLTVCWPVAEEAGEDSEAPKAVAAQIMVGNLSANHPIGCDVSKK